MKKILLTLLFIITFSIAESNITTESNITNQTCQLVTSFGCLVYFEDRIISQTHIDEYYIDEY